MTISNLSLFIWKSKNQSKGNTGININHLLASFVSIISSYFSTTCLSGYFVKNDCISYYTFLPKQKEFWGKTKTDPKKIEKTTVIEGGFIFRMLIV